MYDMIRAGLTEAVPFAKYVGVELLEVGDGFARARLIQRPDISNHIGTIHAGALYTLGETASGAAMTGAFVDMIGGLRPVAAEAGSSYLKLARGTVECSARTSEPPEELRRRLREEHKIVFDVLMELFDEEDRQVAAMTVSWNVRFASPQAGGS
jgi:acyl-coenzyme A thioesterase PaaI-like protein